MSAPEADQRLAAGRRNEIHAPAGTVERDYKLVSALLAYWLVPAEPFRAFFQNEIAELAGRFDAPQFTPHVTIYGGLGGGVDSPGRIIAEVARNAAEPITLRVKGVAWAAPYTKTLFVEFEDSAELAEISQAIHRLSAPSDGYSLKPHLSLLYQHLSEDVKRALAPSIPIPFSEVVFDEIHAITGPAHTDTRADVEAWQVVHRHRLAEH